MAFSLVGWSESFDSAVLRTVAALPDPHLMTQAADIRVPEFAPLLAGAYVVGVNTTRSQLVAPSLRRVINLELTPIDRIASPSSNPPFVDLMASPLPLMPDESLNALAAEDGTGAVRTSVFAWLCDAPMMPVEGEIYSVRVTAASAVAALEWSNRALLFDQVLPAGQYAVIGAVFRATALLAFRLVFPGAYHRPGGIGLETIAQHAAKGQRRGGWGEWGRFGSTVPPTVDYFVSTGTPTPVGELDLIKVA